MTKNSNIELPEWKIEDAEPFAYNTASCRALEKAGFRLEGTLRHNAVKNGQLLDTKLYALIKGDKKP